MTTRLTDLMADDAGDRGRDRLLRAVFDGSSDAKAICDDQGRYRNGNPALLRLLGVTNEELLTRSVRDLMPAGPAGDAAWARFLAAGTEAGTWTITLGNERRVIDYRATAAILPGLHLFVLRDVTEQARSTELRSLLATIVESTVDAIFSTDRAGILTSWNNAAARLMGYSASEAVGMHASAFTPPDARGEQQRALEAVLAGTAMPWREAVRVRKDGSRIPVLIALSPIFDAAGRVVGAAGIARDLTERKEMEEQLRHAQKMEAVGQLAGGIAHDFNNILTVISAYAEALLGELEPSDPHRADVQEISKGAQCAAAVTRQLLAFSRKQRLEPEPLDLDEVVADAAALLRPLLGATVHLSVLPSPTPATVLADRTQLEQVLMNLAVNARDAMPGGGALTIEVGVSNDGPPSAVLSVTDTGVGMTPEVQARAFEPFFTTKPEGQGTGLGLATVHGIVEQSGGTIRVRSRPGQGTTFTITLPLSSAAAAQPAIPAAVLRSVPAGTTVLLVEDEEAVRAITRRLLERAGFTVLAARHGADALRLLEEHRVDVLLSDVVMPELGGVALAQRAVARLPELAVVLMSGYSQDEIRDLGHGRRIDGFLEKPFSAETLRDAVLRALAARKSWSRG